MGEADAAVILKDATLREGSDVPGVALNAEARYSLVAGLAATGVTEVELVAPGRFQHDIETLAGFDLRALGVRTTGLVWASGEALPEQVPLAARSLDRFDLLVPLSPRRPPYERKQKVRSIVDALRVAAGLHPRVGAGFPHATQVEQAFLEDICGAAAQSGAERITIYDTNGSADPFEVGPLVRRIGEIARLDICFHAHNDLGMATANSLAAVYAGARCLDVTVNGLGDRAGNASLEQVAVALAAKGIDPGIRLERLRELSALVARATGVPISPLAPVVGDFAFVHKSPNHLGISEIFEAFDPALIRATRSEVKE